MLWNDEFHLQTTRTRHVKLFSNKALEIIEKARGLMHLMLSPEAKVHGRKLLASKKRIPMNIH